MRQKRSKSYKKQMLVYKNTFKFRLPYQIICDEHIIEETYTKRYNLLNNLNKILQPNIIHASNGSKQETDEASLNPKKTLKLFVTQCSMQHIYETKNEDLIEFVKYNFERRRCNHDYKDPKTSEDCIFSITNVTGKKDENEVIKNINNMVIGTNKHKYIICTQDINLRRKLRRVPGVPIVHFMNSNVLLLEPISDTSKQYSENFESQKLTHGLNDSKNAGFKRSVEQMNNSAAPTETPLPVIKKKSTNNPNPLSVKKKVVKVPVHEKNEETKSESAEPAKKKRKRVRSKKNSNAASEDKEDDKTLKADTSA
jgi:U3 small nucleolar RNA-associated protein 23